MKRLSICMLAVILLLCACSPTETFEDPCVFYYVRKEFTIGEMDSVVAAQSSEGKGSSVQELIAAYLAGPSDPDLSSPFPSGTRLLSITQSEESFSILLSDELSELSGVELSLACICLSKTCLELTEAEYIEIRCETQKLNGSNTIILDRHSVSLTDTYQPSEQKTETAQP